MATYASERIRKGLPRTPGGPAWPDVDGAVLAGASVPAAQAKAAPLAAPLAAPVAAAAESVSSAAAAAAPATETAQLSLRQGLPRVPGGEPWPPGGSVAVPVAADASLPAPAEQRFDTVSEEVSLRQGLPRVAGGEPWPPASTVAVERAIASPPKAGPSAAAAPEPVGEAVPAEPLAVPAAQAVPVIPAAAPTAASSPAAAQTAPKPENAPTPKPAPTPKRDPIIVKGRSLGQWAKLAVLWGGGAIVAATIIVLAARGLTTFQVVRDFLERYPGEYELPEFVDPGFPAWARWSHFLNFFLMVLIIRSGLLVRQQQKPDAFYTPKKGGKKISIYLWLHTSLDLLWLLNGLVFVVLLFASGHWARIVPTSWEVFPNALSAGIQYLTLEWPHEDGWVNYNSLQQIMYFTVVFIAAPLAAITGVRMSEWWPNDAEKLNKLYPAPVARAIHFPVMLFFVLFIIVHVFLVFTTGALKNLNHMFVGTPEPSWLGFWLFTAGLFVTAAVTWAARPLVLAPIAGAFGRVSER